MKGFRRYTGSDGAHYVETDLAPGETHITRATEPILSFVRDGRRTFLWVGNNEQGAMFCFGTLNGPRLMRFARELLAELTKRRKPARGRSRAGRGRPVPSGGK